MATNIIASLHQSNHKLLSEFDAYKRQTEDKILKLEDSIRRGDHDNRQLNRLLQEVDVRGKLRHSPLMEERTKLANLEVKQTRAPVNTHLCGSDYWFEMYSNSLSEMESIRKELDTQRLENKALCHTIEAAIICINESHNELEKHIKKEAAVLPFLNMVRDRIIESKKNT